MKQIQNYKFSVIPSLQGVYNFPKKTWLESHIKLMNANYWKSRGTTLSSNNDRENQPCEEIVLFD